MSPGSTKDHEKYWVRVFDEKVRVEEDPARKLCFSSEANRQSIYEAVLDFIDGPFDKALDAGAGDAELTLRLRQKGNFVVALDISSEMLGLARLKMDPRDPAAGLCRGSFIRPPFKPGSFDLIVASEALQHTPFFPTVYRLIELLRSGGVLVISIPHKAHPIIRRAQKRRAGMFKGIGGEELSRLSRERGIELWVRGLFLSGDLENRYVYGPIMRPPLPSGLRGANRVVLKITKL